MTAKKRVLPLSITHKEKKYYLFDIQHSMKNAEIAANMYASIGPKTAKYIISTEEHGGHTYYGVYCSIKVTIGKKK